MKNVYRLELKPGTKEELLPEFSADFPYIASRAELDQYPGRYVPWHWHNTVELFYMESGMLEYCTPGGNTSFPAGCGGMINSNVLHMTRLQPGTQNNIQFLHLFDPKLIAGEKGSLIDRKYVMPLVGSSQIELIALYPDNAEHAEILKLIRDAFTLPENENGYEVRLRQQLSEIWLRLLDVAAGHMNEKAVYQKASDRIKQMMIYIQEHYSEHISIKKLANMVYLSERECYRVFRECLHMTPTEYIRSYRLQMACQMLVKGNLSLTEIGSACGLGSSSYFGKVFKESMGCTPAQYRRKWQDSER